MQDFLAALLRNHVLINAGMAWFIAQTIKISILYMKRHNLQLKTLLTPGGMPSTHTTVVVTMAVTLGRDLGWDSPVFGLAATVAFVVMYDATGIRRAVGKQAEVVNQLCDEFYQGSEISRERLKELLGHKPVEVFAGVLLGIALAFVF